MTAPLVSVCVPLYNGSRYLDACLEGISQQTFRDFEVLIVDDGSSDDGPSIARRWIEADPRFRLHVNGANLGLVGNWNRCIELAQGAWIKFLFQDDLIDPGALAAMLEAGASGGGFVACARNVIYEGSVDPARRSWYEAHEVALFGIYKGRSRLSADEYSLAKISALDLNIVGEPSVTLIRRELFQRFGGFDPLLVQLCDSEMWNRLACNVGIDYVAARLVSFRVHRDSATQANQARRFRAEALDEIVEWTRLCRSRHLAAFRRVARASGQLSILKRQLLRRTNAAYEKARLAGDRTPEGNALGGDIRAVLPQLPGYRKSRAAYFLYTLRRHLRSARR